MYKIWLKMPLKIIDYKKDSIMLTSQMLLLGCHQSGTIKHARIKVNTFTTINITCTGLTYQILSTLILPL